MSRRIIGKDGSVVSPDEPDDWFADPNPDPDPGVDRPIPVAATRREVGVYSPESDTGRRGDPSVLAMLAAPRRRRTTVLLAMFAALAAVVLILLIVLDGGESVQPTPTTEPFPSGGVTTAEPPPVESPQTEAPTPQLTIALPESGTLLVGDEGPMVTRLQKALAALATSPGEADGVFGSQTRSAVIAFQEAQGLSPDGIVGVKTAAAINAALAAQGN